MTNGSNERPTVASLDKRVTRTEDKIISHERECALRYESLEGGIERVGHLVADRFAEIMNVLGTSEKQGLRADVSSLLTERAKRNGIYIALGGVGGVALTVLGWFVGNLLNLI